MTSRNLTPLIETASSITNLKPSSKSFSNQSSSNARKSSNTSSLVMTQESHLPPLSDSHCVLSFNHKREDVRTSTNPFSQHVQNSSLPPPPPVLTGSSSQRIHRRPSTGPTSLPPPLLPPPPPRQEQPQEQSQQIPIPPTRNKKKKRRPIRKLVKLFRRSSSQSSTPHSSSTTSLLTMGTTIDLNGSIGTIELDSQSVGWEEGDLDYSYLEYEHYQTTSQDVTPSSDDVGNTGGDTVGGDSGVATDDDITSNHVQDSKNDMVVPEVEPKEKDEHTFTTTTSLTTVEPETTGSLEQKELSSDSNLQPSQDSATTTVTTTLPSTTHGETQGVQPISSESTIINHSQHLKAQMEQLIKEGKDHYRQGLYQQALQIQRSALASIEEHGDDTSMNMTQQLQQEHTTLVESAETAYHRAILKHDLAKTKWRIAKQKHEDLQHLTDQVHNSKVQVWVTSVRYLHGELIQKQSTTMSLLQKQNLDKDGLGHVCHHLYILHSLGSLCHKHLHQYDHAIQYYQQALDLESKVFARLEEKRQADASGNGLDLKELKQWSMRVRTTRKKLGAIHYITGRFDLALTSSFASNVSSS